MDPSTPDTEFHVEANGQLHGPGTFDQLRQWVVEGRILADTVLVGVTTGQRIFAKDLPGLFDGITPPPPVGGGYAPPMYAQPYPPKKGMPGWGIALIVTCAACLFCGPVLAAILFPVFAQARQAAIHTSALSNMKQLGLSTLMYANDFNDNLPPAMESAAAAEPFLSSYAKKPEIFKSLNPEGGEILGDKRLAGMSLNMLSDTRQTVMFYDNWPNGITFMSFADGHARRGSAMVVQQSLSMPLGGPSSPPEASSP